MIVTIRDMIKDENQSIACVPFGEGRGVSLDECERATLKAFQGISFEIEATALPLQVYLMGGRFSHLAIHPKEGIIKIGRSQLAINDGEKRGIVIFRDPLT